MSYGASEALLAEIINRGIVCMCLPVRAHPIYVHPSVCLSIRLSAPLSKTLQ